MSCQKTLNKSYNGLTSELSQIFIILMETSSWPCALFTSGDLSFFIFLQNLSQLRFYLHLFSFTNIHDSRDSRGRGRVSASSRNGLKVNFRRKSLFCLLLALCGDIESCPETSYTNISNILTSKGFTVLHQNRGLHGKKGIISDILFNNTKVDIFFLSETFISCDDAFDPTIRGFDFEPKSRSNGATGGGVSAYIKNGMPYTRRVDLETDDLEITWLEINFKNCKSFAVGVLYHPPDNSKYSNKNFLKSLSDVLNKLPYEDKETTLMGDINPAGNTRPMDFI